MKTSELTGSTVLEAVREAVTLAGRYNSGDAVAPAAILWTDAEGEWSPIVEKLTHAYLGDWITRQRAEVKDGKEGADARLVIVLALKERLEAIIAGEPPFDIFVRWKPLAKQAIGWEPDINDGVRMNIRPFMASDLPACRDVRGAGRPGGKRGAGVLRTAPKIKWTKDRGKEPNRPRDEYPWFWGWEEKTKDFMGGKAFDGNRWNDCHYSNDVKRKARG